MMLYIAGTNLATLDRFQQLLHGKNITSGVHLLVKLQNDLDGQDQCQSCPRVALSISRYITGMNLATLNQFVQKSLCGHASHQDCSYQ